MIGIYQLTTNKVSQTWMTISFIQGPADWEFLEAEQRNQYLEKVY